MHQRDLLVDYLFAVFRMLHGLALEVEILWVNRLLVEQLVKFRTQIL
jgi:hypothetical protein